MTTNFNDLSALNSAGAVNGTETSYNLTDLAAADNELLFPETTRTEISGMDAFYSSSQEITTIEGQLSILKDSYTSVCGNIDTCLGNITTAAGTLETCNSNFQTASENYNQALSNYSTAFSSFSSNFSSGIFAGSENNSEYESARQELAELSQVLIEAKEAYLQAEAEQTDAENNLMEYQDECTELYSQRDNIIAEANNLNNQLEDAKTKLQQQQNANTEENSQTQTYQQQTQAPVQEMAQWFNISNEQYQIENQTAQYIQEIIDQTGNLRTNMRSMLVNNIMDILETNGIKDLDTDMDLEDLNADEILDAASKALEETAIEQTYSKGTGVAKTDTASSDEHATAESDFTDAYLAATDVLNTGDVEFTNYADQSNYELAQKTIDRINDGEYINTSDLEKRTSATSKIQFSEVSSNDNEAEQTKYDSYSQAILKELEDALNSEDFSVIQQEYSLCDSEQGFNYLLEQARKNNINQAITE